jgi:hypothetical protein
MPAKVQSNRNSHSLPVGMQKGITTFEESFVSYKKRANYFFIMGIEIRAWHSTSGAMPTLHTSFVF